MPERPTIQAVDAAHRLAAERPRLEFASDREYSPAPEAVDHVRLERRYGLFVGGELVAPRSKRYFATVNPATENPSPRSPRSPRRARPTSTPRSRPRSAPGGAAGPSSRAPSGGATSTASRA